MQKDMPMKSPRSHRQRSLRTPARETAVPGLNAAESPLAWLARRKDKDGQPLISREQFESGERLRRDFTFALLSPRVTANWSALPSSGGRADPPGLGADMADAVAAARERVNRALAAVGPELSGILLDVCCYLKGLESLEKSAGWPQRSGKIVLVIALQQLARHYGLTGSGVAPAPGTPRMRHWGVEDYRPSINPHVRAESG